MKIKSTTITQEGEVKTENARYDVSYTIKDNQLQVVTAQVNIASSIEVPDGNGGTITQEHYTPLGSLALEYSTLKAPQFPYTEKYPVYVSEFMDIITEITQKKKETA